MRKYHKEIAPRLWGKQIRDHYTGGLPPAIKHGLQEIAYRERKSVSWVLEQVIISYFKLPMPKYKERKNKTTKIIHFKKRA